MIYIHTELGLEKRCPCCHDYYPYDNEFFYRNGINKYTAQCKACYIENYRGA